MKISIIAVGKIKDGYLRDGISEYKKRLKRFCDLEIIEIQDEQAPENLSVADEVLVKNKEAERVLKRIKSGSKVIVLDVKGSPVSSEGLANRLKSFFVEGNSSIIFIIGGSLGLGEELVKRADSRISFSKLTFPHQLIRLILVEQIYRAFKIISGEVYHK